MIRIFHDWRELPADARGATVALGNFDGVHRGHAEVIKAAHAARPKVPLGVLTFEPHPREHFRPDDPPFRLTLSAERADALEALGVTLLYELPLRPRIQPDAGRDLRDRGAASGSRRAASGVRPGLRVRPAPRRRHRFPRRSAPKLSAWG